MLNTYVSIIGYAAATLTTIAYLPQVIKTIRVKKTDELSLLMFLSSATGVFLWLVYGILIGDIPLIAANSITLVLALCIIWYKIKLG
jgi:MtN3 and saliva related transmembrane protein